LSHLTKRDKFDILLSMPKRTTPENSRDIKTPTVAQRDFPFRRNNTYFIEGEINGEKKTLELPGVTTILSTVSNKSSLINWAAKEAANVALMHPEMSVEEIVANSSTLRKQVAIDLGKTIHKFAEDWNNGEMPKAEDLKGGTDEETEILQNHANAFVSFIELHKPRILFTEACVFNVTHGYAGTADLIAVLSNGKTAILDWKTGKNTYKESHLQQMAYANAEWIYTKDRKILKMPTIHEQYLVHLKANGTAQLIPVKEPFQKFLDALAFYPTAKWLQEW